MEIPKGHGQVMPYLILNSAGKFAEFTKAVFGAEVTTTRLREGTNTVMHSEIKIGTNTIMFADATDQWPDATANLFIYVDNADTTYALALQKGATSVMELSTQDYGRTCGVKDPTGNTWWITSVNK